MILQVKLTGVKMIIRKERESDFEAITNVTKLAFATLALSPHTEEFIIKALRNAGVLTLSLVAESEDKIIGHIAFSPVTISDGSDGWYGLGPISVLPELHRKGIGKALMHEGLSILKEMGAKGVVLVGDPNYYQRFGFRNIPELTFEGVPQEYFMALPLGKYSAHGAVEFHEGFNATA